MFILRLGKLNQEPLQYKSEILVLLFWSCGFFFQWKNCHSYVCIACFHFATECSLEWKFKCHCWWTYDDEAAIDIYDRCPKTVNANNVQAQQCKLNRFDVNLKVFPHPCSNLGVRPVWDIRTVSFTSALQTSKVMLTIQLGCWLAWTGVYWGQNQNVSQCLLILTCLQPIAVFMKVIETFGHGQCATYWWYSHGGCPHLPFTNQDVSDWHSQNLKLFERNRTKGSSGQTRSISRICCLICLTDSPTNTPNNFDQWLMIKVLKVMLSEHVVDGYG